MAIAKNDLLKKAKLLASAASVVQPAPIASEAWNTIEAERLTATALAHRWSGDYATDPILRHQQFAAADAIDSAFKRQDLTGLRQAVAAFHRLLGDPAWKAEVELTEEEREIVAAMERDRIPGPVGMVVKTHKGEWRVVSPVATEAETENAKQRTQGQDKQGALL